jgi:acyl carrier protein
MKTMTAYVALMSELLSIELPIDLSSEMSIFDDWGLDSLQAFELIILTEDLAGLVVPPAQIPPIYTVGDAFIYYEQCFHAARPPAADEP